MLPLLGPPRKGRRWPSPPWRLNTNQPPCVEERSAGYANFGLNWVSKLEGPTLVYGDNNARLALCSSQQTTPMSKHIHIIHCWVSEKVEDKEICFKHTASADNASDVFHQSPLQTWIWGTKKEDGTTGAWVGVGDLMVKLALHMFISSTW